MAVTMKDVAKAANVSAKTVSNALNGYPFMKPDTRQRVLDAVERLAYVPNQSARSLRSGRSRVIGLALPDLRNAYFAELADAVTVAAERRGLTVAISLTKGERQRELDVLHGQHSATYDGLLLNALALCDEDGPLLAGRVPTVLLGDHVLNPPTDHVTMPNVEAARAMTHHLLSQGRRRIAVIGAHEDEVVGSAGLRLEGYRQAHREAGVDIDERLIGYVKRWHRSDGTATMDALLDSGVLIDAVFGLNDMLALGAMRSLQRRGFTIPEDVAVVGFDNLEESRYSLPALTAVDPGVVEIAETALSILERRIVGDDCAPHHVQSAFELAVRESSVNADNALTT
ncbi:LacI family DNA-binding transcriptional regulator [Microbacterium sp.]|uniref:LacI family DNA-binding transcriptional regulator n=1 Tax=Microbacterium sp. TaxID=51671 RepID=UPI0039E49455